MSTSSTTHVPYMAVSENRDEKEVVVRIAGQANPVRISKEQMALIDITHLTALFASTSTPSQAAGLQGKVLCPLVFQIDQGYRAALMDYKNELAMAYAKDVALRAIKDKLSPKELFRALHITLPSGICLVVKRLVVALWSLISGGPKQKSVESETLKKHSNAITVYKERASSVSRTDALVRIDDREKVRLNKAKADLLARVATVFSDFQKMQQQGFHDATKIEELTQLNSVFRVLFPDLEITVNNGQKLKDAAPLLYL